MSLGRTMRRAGLVSVAAAAAMVAGLTPASAAPFDDASGTAAGSVLVPYLTPGTPVLDHFRFTYNNADHHLRTLAAQPELGKIEVAFADQNNDDFYDYSVRHQRFVPEGIFHGSFTDICKGQCSHNIFRPAGDFVFVLSGFRFEYWEFGTDHHVAKIGVMQDGDSVTTTFEDKNGDDEYQVTISYAWVPGNRFGVIDEAAGNVQGAGRDTVGFDRGDAVIRGFLFQYLTDDDDTQIHDFGVLTNSDSFEVFFSDQDPTDSPPWRWDVRYATVI